MCTQAFRLGDSAWGVQFHPEVTLEQVERWLEEDEPVPLDRDGCSTDTRERIDEWNELGRTLCDAFVDVAETASLTLSWLPSYAASRRPSPQVTLGQPFRGQVVARPLVPRAGVVARAVAGGAQARASRAAEREPEWQ